MHIMHLDDIDSDVVRQTRVETKVHQRQCERCHRWFWAWDWSRWKCFVCDPLPPEQLRTVLNAIHGESRAQTEAPDLALAAR